MNTPDRPPMRAAVLDAFGGSDKLQLRQVARPQPAPNQALIRVEAAGVGAWDAEEREGHYDRVFGIPSSFPYILGWDGAGVIEAVGGTVQRFQPGDQVIAASMPVPNGGFYADYAVVDEENLALAPANLPLEQAAALPWDGLTAQSGLNALEVRQGNRIVIIGASGGIGHLALQLAKSRGASVLAIASGDDGVNLCRELGADQAIDGRREDILAAVRDFAPDRTDGILTLVGGETIGAVLHQLGPDVPVAVPHGVTPELNSGKGSIRFYNGERGEAAFARLLEVVAAGKLRVHVAETFPLEEVGAAHERLKRHYLGKLALTMDR